MAIKNFIKNDPTPSIWWYTAWTRTKARFVRTYLGSFWIGISNLLAICVLGSVYRFIFNVENFKYYFGYLGVGLTLWGFCSGAILSSSTLFQGTRDRSLNSEFTPSYFFLEEIAFQFYIFIQASTPILILIFVIGLSNPINWMIAILPLINFFLIVFIISGIVGLIGAKYKDLAQLVPVILQLVFLSSPIMFFREAMGRAYIVSKYNILYRFLSSVRTAILDGNISFLVQIIFFPILILLSYLVYKLIVKLRNEIILWY